MSNNRVVVTGLRETTKAIKAMEAESPKVMRVALKRVAGVVVDKVRSRMPRRTGRAANSVKPRGGVRGVGIAMGGAAAPYAPWLDFGGTVGPGHRPGQARSGATYRRYMGAPVGKGRYLYPVIEENIEEVQEVFVEELNQLLRQYGMKAD